MLKATLIVFTVAGTTVTTDKVEFERASNCRVAQEEMGLALQLSGWAPNGFADLVFWTKDGTRIYLICAKEKPRKRR